MAEELTLTHERVDDIPLLIGLAQKLHLPEVLDRHLGNHGNHQGLSNGWLATVWLAYILSESDHRKSSVEEWAWAASPDAGTAAGATHSPHRIQ
jgi:transposase